MITDDATISSYRELQIYLFSNTTATHHYQDIAFPALELDYGVVPGTELHMFIQYVTATGNNVPRATGAGDTEMGFKTVIVDERPYFPKVAIAPVIELPSGNAKRNLGNGRAWYIFPIWLEKTKGNWDTYGGGGYIYNTAPQTKKYFFGGWNIQYQATEKLQISAEVYGETRSSSQLSPQPQPAFALLNFGVSYQILPYLAIQASVGHSFVGDSQWINYIDLFWDKMP